MSLEPTSATRPSDEELMEGVRQHDPEALSQLYDRYSGILKALAMRIVHNEAESEDLLQEIYMDIWNHSQNYVQERGKALGWMVTLTRRRSIDRLRKRLSYARVEERLQRETEQQPGAWNHHSADDDLEASDMRAVLIKIMERLPLAQREAIDLAYFKGMSQREIAAHTGIPLGTIKTRLELGLKKISDGLKGLKHEF
jgi:RNA polymerase sigma-70 factor (ECF subfamily)